MSTMTSSADGKRPPARHESPKRNIESRSWHKEAFSVLFFAHLLAAVYAPIQDCDEVYNFWEPTHYLTHGCGLQTWELSPTYAIRSWFYIALHAAPIKLLSLFSSSLSANKTINFYFLRIILATVSALCETRLYGTIARCLNQRLAALYVFITATATGSFIATASYLPSSFAMNTMTLALAAALDIDNGSRMTKVLTWLAIGTIIGWPFVAILCLPFVLQEVYGLLSTHKSIEKLKHLAEGLLRALGVLALEISVDSLFYRKLTCTPWNIVYYNIFSGPGRGADIYGTEPWHFYLHNLGLNFNFWLPLALSALPLLLLYRLMQGGLFSRTTTTDGIFFALPPYLWIGVMSYQAHKEERFMYPIYPCLALNAAISLHVVTLLVSHARRGSSLGRVPGSIKLAVFVGILSILGSLGVWRSLGIATAYGAPLRIYQHLHNDAVTDAKNFSGVRDINVCVGKEWYRFPSSYHLPSPPTSSKVFRLRYIQSAFHGLLPGQFVEEYAEDLTGIFPGAWLEPEGMNDRNEEDLGKYVAIEECHFLVDSRFEGANPNDEEPDYVSMAQHDEKDWIVVTCDRFLDQSRSGLLGRLGWTPEWSAKVPYVGHLAAKNWGEYCLLQRRL